MPKKSVKRRDAAPAAGDAKSAPKTSTSDAPSRTEAAPSASAAPPSSGTHGGGGDEPEEDMLLVSEFPPPPFYYHLASRGTPSHQKLVPPEIPARAFRVAAKRVGRERAKAREESERMRLEAEGGVGAGGTGEGASSEDNTNTKSTGATAADAAEDDDSIDPDDPTEPVVAVFGEIVEDPTLSVEEECPDPVAVRENVQRLNRAVLDGFLELVRKLVDDPGDNKKLRDELSHNLFLMLQECNKFREHQAREILIETLELQLAKKEEGLAALRGQVADADEVLAALREFRQN